MTQFRVGMRVIGKNGIKGTIIDTQDDAAVPTFIVEWDNNFCVTYIEEDGWAAPLSVLDLLAEEL